MQLRYYQSAAIESAWNWIKDNDGNPCIVIPTGGGKSAVMGTLAQQVVEWGSRCLILAHVKELVDQNARELCGMAPHVNVGVYSAGLKQRNTTADVISCGIQSVYSKAELFQTPPPDIILVDEAHLIPKDSDGMYRKFLADMESINPNVRVIGLTATPYRTSTGLIVGGNALLTEICYEVKVNELIAAGYLSPLVSKTARKVDTQRLHIRRGEFVADEAEALMLETVDVAVCDMLDRAADRKSILVFAQSVKHAWAVQELLEQHGEVSHVITGATAPEERDKLIQQFKDQDFRILVNVMVLTTGFNARGVDCVALMRPTISQGLFYQMVGRGLRLSPETGKANCLVLDYGGNIKRHGPIDKIAPPSRTKSAGGAEQEEADQQPITKTCIECQTEVWIEADCCPECGFEFAVLEGEEVKHDTTAADDSIISEDVEPDIYKVTEVNYSAYEKRNAEPGKPKTMRVDYICGFGKAFSEWVCVEHTGWARKNASKWWAARLNVECPSDAAIAAKIAEQHMPAPIEITVIKDGKYDRVTEFEFGEIELPVHALISSDELVREPGWEDEPVAANEFDDDFEAPF